MINKTMKENIDKALKLAWSYGQIDGESHKMWVIDQMVRILCGSEEEYAEWVKRYEIVITYGDYFEWKMGIAP